jgi:hypothetical protein
LRHRVLSRPAQGRTRQSTPFELLSIGLDKTCNNSESVEVRIGIHTEFLSNFFAAIFSRRHPGSAAPVMRNLSNCLRRHGKVQIPTYPYLGLRRRADGAVPSGIDREPLAMWRARDEEGMVVLRPLRQTPAVLFAGASLGVVDADAFDDTRTGRDVEWSTSTEWRCGPAGSGTATFRSHRARTPVTIENRNSLLGGAISDTCRAILHATETNHG